jgi:ankyrin repeat protein
VRAEALIQWCAYYGDVSAIRFLLVNGESLESLGDNLGLHQAAFHGHWQLCQFLIEKGANVNLALPNTGETPLHSATCKANRPAYSFVLKVLLAKGANPNSATKAGAETGRLCGTREPKGRRRSIVPRRLEPRRRLNCFSMRVPGVRRRT